jgi:periplasmic protein TonB
MTGDCIVTLRTRTVSRADKTSAVCWMSPMSHFALAQDLGVVGRRSAGRRRPIRTPSASWRDVPVAAAAPAAQKRPSGRPVYLGALAAVVIAVHGAVVWYATHHVSPQSPRPKHEVAVEIVTPPKPPLPKREPPKPPPPRPQVRKQVVPEIQTAVPDTPSVEVAPGETLAAVTTAPTPPPPPPPEPVTAPFGRAGYLNNPPPEYPAAAARQGWQGTVLLRVRVLSSGKVDTVELQKSSGHKLLDDEAITTVRTWVFSPSKRGSTPIDGWATVPIEFKLDT